MEAEMIRSLLRTEGIESMKRKTDFAAGASDAAFPSMGPFEILVTTHDLDTARELLAGASLDS
jgi:Putative prokaryotic signal transducing protein